MKNSSRGYFILSITFFLISLLWFLWIKNTIVGVIWLCIGIIELIIAVTSKRDELKRK